MVEILGGFDDTFLEALKKVSHENQDTKWPKTVIDDRTPAELQELAQQIVDAASDERKAN